MSFEIKKGLYNLDTFEDHHAALGLPVNADASQVRKRYLRIARKLHPDSMVGCSAAEKAQATEVLSKLVNPAYEMLSQDKNRKEYLVLTRLKGQQVKQQKDTLTTGLGEDAKKLGKAPNVEGAYKQLVTQLASTQFDELDKIVEVVGSLSELNLVYLLRQQGNAIPKSPAKPAASPAAGAAQPPAPGMGRPPMPPGNDNQPTIIQTQAHQMSLADGYLRRAEEYLRKKALSQAILELRDGLRAAPKDSRCHSLMGMIYLQQNQATMAKVSIRKALELNPKDLRAIEGRRKLSTMGHKIELAGEANSAPAGGNNATSAKGRSKAGTKSGSKSKGGGGLFGGMFGGGKSKRK